MSRKLIRNTISNAVFHICGFALGFFTVPILLNHLGDARYGLMLLVTALVGYFELMGAGVPAGSIKFIAEYEAKGDDHEINEIINTSLNFYLGIGAAVALTLFLAAYFGFARQFVDDPQLASDIESLFYVAAFVALVRWPTKAIGSAIKGFQEYHSVNKIYLSTRVFSQVSVIIAAIAGGSLVVVFAVQEITRFVAQLFYYRLLKRTFPALCLRLGRFSKTTFNLIFGLSAFVLLNQVARMLVYETDKLIVGAMLPVAMLSVYAVVFKPGEIVRMFTELFNSAILPAISELEQISAADEVKDFIYSGSRYNNAIAAPVAIIATYLAEPFIRLWVGERFVEWAWVAQVAALFMLIWTSNTLVNRVCFGLNKAKRLTYIEFATAILNVILSIFLVDSLGVAGVILATVFVGPLNVGMGYMFVFPEIQISRWRYFRQCFVGAQWSHWCLGLLLIPFWSEIQSIESWSLFILIGIVLSLGFFSITWFQGIRQEHRKAVLDFIRRA